MSTYLISEKRRRKRKGKFKAIGFNPNFWDNPLDSAVADDGAFATLGNDSTGPSESIVFTTNKHSIEIEQLLLDGNTDRRLDSIHEQFKSLPIIFNPGVDQLDKFFMFERYYGNFVILKNAI